MENFLAESSIIPLISVSGYELVDRVGFHYSGYDAGFVFLVDDGVQNHDILLFWQVKPVVHVFQVKFA